MKTPRQAVGLVKLPGRHGVSIAAKNLAEQWQTITEEVKQKIKQSNAKDKVATDKHRRKQVFAVGDQVMVFYVERSFLWAHIASCNPRSMARTKLSRRSMTRLMW